MTSLPLYSKERVEELRSRISILECSVQRLEQDFRMVYNRFVTRDKTAPFMLPVSTFQKLTSLITDLKTICEHANPDAIPDLVVRCYTLDRGSERLLFQLMTLQNVLAQRISGLGLMKLLEYQQVFAIEYGTVIKAYNAVDALSFELVEKVLGSEWVSDNSYTPISLFDSAGYAISMYSNIVSVPYHDSFRARFWPALAHEVAHMLVGPRILARQDSAFKRVMLDGISRLLEILEYRFDDVFGREIASLQVIELTCDIVAAYSCPASFLSAVSILSAPFEEENAEGALKKIVKEVAHPPSDARIAAMRRVLEKTGILETDRDIYKLSEAVTNFYARKNFALLSGSSSAFLRDYNEFAEIYCERIMDLLPQVGVSSFDGNKWSVIQDAFQNPRDVELSPVQLICLDWVKRIRITRNDGYLRMRNFFNRRRAEPKIYENMVNSMYDYYEKKWLATCGR